MWRGLSSLCTYTVSLLVSNLLSVVVSAVSLLDEGNQENDCEHDAKTTHYDVANSKEVVLSSKGIGG